MSDRDASGAAASEAWRRATDLLRGWLGVLAPPSGLAQVFGDLGVPSAPTGDASETPHFRQFAAALREFAEWYGETDTARLDMTGIVALWLGGIRAQVGALAATLAAEGDVLGAWLEAQSRPILGPAREAHARWAAVARAGAAQLRAQRTLQRMHLEALEGALDLCLTRLGDSSLPKIGNVRALFKEWSECVDATYRARALTPDYAQAFGECINAGSALAVAWQNWQRGAHGAPTYPAAPAAPPTAGKPSRTPSSEKPAESATPPPVDIRKGPARRGRPQSSTPRVRASAGGDAKSRARREKPASTTARGSVPRAPAPVTKPRKRGDRSTAGVSEFDIAGIGRPEGT